MIEIQVYVVTEGSFNQPCAHQIVCITARIAGTIKVGVAVDAGVNMVRTRSCGEKSQECLNAIVLGYSWELSGSRNCIKNRV